MKKPAKLFTALICLATVSLTTIAEEKTAPPPPPTFPPHQGMGGMGGGMGMMGGISEEQINAHLRQMQEKMLMDYDFMRKIREAKDEKEQAKLKEEWLQSMKQHIKPPQMPPQLKMHGMPEKPPVK